MFKGGTCFKKCFFETYRFSEDLDFTLTDPEHLSEDFLRKTFSEIADWFYETAGIELPVDRHKFDIYQNPRGSLSAEGKVGYRGPLQRRGDPPRIKLDLASDEILVLEPVLREVHHPYSDRPAEGMNVHCYAFEEVFAEKMRALAERERPRDLYDVVHLYRRSDLRPDRALVRSTLKEKCDFKGIPVPTYAVLANSPNRVELEAEWSNMRAHQLPELPPFEQFWQELPEVFEWLNELLEKPAIQPIPSGVGVSFDNSWQLPPMSIAWKGDVPLESIRFAAANRLCVDLDYQGSTRKIEPYSLRRNSENHLILYAVKHDSGESRSYRVDRITGARATSTPFIPRYQIELTASGPLSAPSVVRNSGAVRMTPTIAGYRATARPARRSTARNGPVYVFQCMSCGKKFPHRSYDSSLNAHKDKHGYQCPSRIGFLVETKY